MPYEINIDEFPQPLREFASYKTAIQGCSQKTADDYMLDLRTFFRYYYMVQDSATLTQDEFEKISITALRETDVKQITTQFIVDYLKKS